MTSREANALTVLGLVGLLGAVAMTAPRWAALLRAPAGPVETEEASGEEAARVAPDAASAGRRINVRLYFEAPDREGLLPEEREVAFSPDLAVQLRTVVEELAKGSTTGLVPTLAPGTRVLEVFVQARGVAYVDLSPEAAALPGGSKAEVLTVYSIVNTIVTNFPSVSRVQIVVDDKPVTSLGGHVDLSRPLPPDMTLLAQPSPSPSAGEASPGSPPAEGGHP